MDAVLDELTLVECTEFEIGSRIQELAKALSALDELGAPRVVRTVSDAAVRSVSGGHGLIKWCFDASVDKDAGRLVARRISSQPYIDGHGGLMLAVEEERAIDCSVQGARAIGLAYCFFTNGLPVGLSGSSYTSICDRQVSVCCVSESEDWKKEVVVRLILTAGDVERDKVELTSKIHSHIRTGPDILNRAHEVFPTLRFGKTAAEQLSELHGTESFFPSIVRHFRALHEAATRSLGGGTFEPEVSWSVESEATLQHSRFGPMRDFPWPDGCNAKRWSKHSKTGSTRIYFEPGCGESSTEVCVGYVGRHLPTVDHPN